MGQQLNGAVRKMTPHSLHAGARPVGPSGKRSDGRIVKLLVGNGCGYIRLDDAREVYFHRADLHEGTSFNDFAVGDSVSFELLEDAVSGARALRVSRRRRRC